MSLVGASGLNLWYTDIMKRMKPASKTPVDVRYALKSANNALYEVADALARIDPAAFATCTRYNDAWEDLRSLQAHVAALLADRPLTKNERAAAAASA